MWVREQIQQGTITKQLGEVSLEVPKTEDKKEPEKKTEDKQAE